jgi:hypothetical protein
MISSALSAKEVPNHFFGAAKNERRRSIKSLRKSFLLHLPSLEK